MTEPETILSIKESLRKAASKNSGRVHVIPLIDEWAVSSEGKERKIYLKKTKAEALALARKIKSASSIVIHKKDGSVLKFEEINK